LVTEIRLRAHAKINLYLDVIGERRDGYHDIRSIMQSLALADELVISKADELKLSLSGEFKVPVENNLVLRVARALRDETGNKEGALIVLDKKVPVAAGLGGGSADAAAALIGLNMLWGLDLSPSDLQIVGGKIGADIPFCLQGGICLVEGKGDKVSPLPYDFKAHVVIAKPFFSLSTADVYSSFDKVGSTGISSIESINAALGGGRLRNVSVLLANALEKVVILKYPLINEIKERALQTGALGVLMSGSGSSVFAIAESEKVAHKIAASLKDFCRDVIITSTYQKGVDIFL